MFLCRLLLKKIWSHGQLIAPFQGLALGYWGISSNKLYTWERAILIIAALVLPAWSAITWWAMKGTTINHGRLILCLGVYIEVLYAAVLVVAARGIDTTNSLRLFALVSTILQVSSRSKLLLEHVSLNVSAQETNQIVHL